ncbi:MAG: transposase [Bacteriovoracales bacterium]|nr:transposase [Bacteriovoracales bacterium]
MEGLINDQYFGRMAMLSPLAKRFEMIYTPKKASWLNMAEIEFSALSKQCLDRRIGDMNTMKKEVGAWTKKRNRDRVKIDWQFTKNSAREKFQVRYFDAMNL